ncbi:nickel/cobalt transporter [Pseudaeromonas sp. ZJS20]|uniref:nickel/cobalt transporter n=1 Tax=Pseudaeromonas aegiceratis TaxID=3153928 RepID=UPI00390C7FBC
MTAFIHRHWPRLLLLLALAGLGAWLWQAWPGLRFELARLQLGFQRELGQLLRSAQSWQPSTVLALLALSFGYGVCHAAGPGHGKLVLSTYLATHPSRLGQAIRLSVGAALLQALVAIALIGLGGWLLDLSARQAQGVGVGLEKASYLLVMGLGAWIAWRALRALWQRKPLVAPAIHALRPLRHQGELLLRPRPQADCGCGHQHVPQADQLNGSPSWQTRAGLLLAMGLRPCSGALLLLVLAKVLQQFWLGALATLAMAAGTALTVSALALLSRQARQLALALSRGNRHAEGLLPKLGQGLALLGGLVLIIGGLGLYLAPTSLLLPR